MANSTGKAARKRWGTRFAAKAAGSGAAGGRGRSRRRTWGKLTYSVAAGNVPMGAISANDALLERIFDERRKNGWEDDANVSVPGPTRTAVMSRRPAIRGPIEGDGFYLEERECAGEEGF